MKLKKLNCFIFLLLIILIFIIIFNNINNSSYCDGGVISFTFDDGTIDQYINAYPIFSKYNITGTNYIIAGLVGNKFENKTLMNWSHIKELQNSNWELASHTLTHNDMTKMNDSQIEFEFSESKRILNNNGFNIISVSIPYGHYNDQIKLIAKKYYNSIRPSTWGYNDINNFDKYNISSIWITNRTQMSFLKKIVDNTLINNTWTVFMLHLVTTNNSYEYSIHPNILENLINYIKAKQIEIKTVSEIIMCDR